MINDAAEDMTPTTDTNGLGHCDTAMGVGVAAIVAGDLLLAVAGIGFGVAFLGVVVALIVAGDLLLSGACERRCARAPRRQADQRAQHQSAATRPYLTDRIQPLPPSTKNSKTFSDLAATSYGSEG